MDRQTMLDVLLQLREFHRLLERRWRSSVLRGEGGGMNTPLQEGFPRATAQGKEPPCSLGEGLFVCLLGQSISEKLLP